ncbi:MAG: type II toxin-antitoxin system VapC family toxin [Victivallales bacterium]|nr:type II toxin-antitoxin system VapC family toxin [Victivallales bacterium]
MKYLLDTNVWFWMLGMQDKLRPSVKEMLRDAVASEIGISAISPWEIAKKVSLGKLVLSCPIDKWIESATRPEEIEMFPLTPEVAVESTKLPGCFHNDPADQIIVATARLHGLVLLTSDERIRKYAHVKSFWA